MENDAPLYKVFFVKGDVPAWPVAMKFIVHVATYHADCGRSGPTGKFTQTQVAS